MNSVLDSDLTFFLGTATIDVEHPLGVDGWKIAVFRKRLK
jgi:hypothetical protein